MFPGLGGSGLWVLKGCDPIVWVEDVCGKASSVEDFKVSECGLFSSLEWAGSTVGVAGEVPSIAWG